MEMMLFLDGATKVDSVLRAYKIPETKIFFSYEIFDQHDNLQNAEFPRNNAFCSKFCSCNLLKAEKKDYINLLNSILTTEQAVIEWRLANLTTNWD